MDFQTIRPLGDNCTNISGISASELLAWDPDFTKLTPSEAESIALAEKDEFISDADIDWDNFGQYA